MFIIIVLKVKKQIRGNEMILDHKTAKKNSIFGTAIFISFVSSAVLGQTDLSILVGTGVGNILDSPRGGYVSFELRKPIIKYKNVTLTGNVVLEGENDDKYVGLGASVEKRLSSRIKIAATTGVGRFSNINLNLGSKTEFRNGIDLFYKISSKVMVVLSFYHYSNGGISDYNPGTESVALRFVIPLAGNS